MKDQTSTILRRRGCIEARELGLNLQPNRNKRWKCGCDEKISLIYRLRIDGNQLRVDSGLSANNEQQ